MVEVAIKLFLVHCGYYDSEVAGGLYEGHVNYFVVADSFNSAKVKIRESEEYKRKKMHVDGMQEIQIVDGHKINLEFNKDFLGQSKIINIKDRELASTRN